MNQDISLAMAKSWLRERVNKGARCPCCHQFAKIYSRQITSRMAYYLILLYKMSRGNEYIHVNELNDRTTNKIPLYGGGDFAKLSYWKLIEPLPKDDDDDDGAAKTSGYWRITEIGKKFVEGKTDLFKYANIYDGRIMGYSGDKQTIQEALKNKFNYRELMNDLPNFDGL